MDALTATPVSHNGTTICVVIESRAVFCVRIGQGFGVQARLGVRAVVLPGPQGWTAVSADGDALELQPLLDALPDLGRMLGRVARSHG